MSFESIIKWFTVTLLIICFLIIVYFVAVRPDLLKDLEGMNIKNPWECPFPQILYPIAWYTIFIITIISTWIGLGCKCRRVQVEYSSGSTGYRTWCVSKNGCTCCFPGDNSCCFGHVDIREEY